MRFISTYENLVRGVTAVSPLAGRNPQLPVLQNVLLVVKEGVMHLTCTDLEVGVHAVVTGKSDKDGNCVVPARQLLEFVQNLPKDNPITLERAKDTLSVTTEGYSAQFPVFVTDDFPLLPEASGDTTFSLDGRLLAQALSHTAFAAASDDTRPELHSVYLKGEGDQLFVAATDSFRLAEYSLGLEVERGFSLLLPTQAASEVVRLFGGVDLITGTVQKGYVAFEGGGYQLSSRLVDGNYPEYQSIIPTTHSTKGVVNLSEFLQALKTVNIFRPRDTHRVAVQALPLEERLVLKVEGGESGRGEVSVVFHGEGDDVEALFNIQYLIDGAGHGVGETTRLAFGGVSDPLVFRPAKDALPYVYIVMPIQA